MIYHGGEPTNVPGAIVRYPRLRFPEHDLNYTKGFGKDAIKNIVLEWIEGTLKEPVNGQVVVTKEHGLKILSHYEFPLVEIIRL